MTLDQRVPTALAAQGRAHAPAVVASSIGAEDIVVFNRLVRHAPIPIRTW
jgi:hypothetical protein